VFANRVGLGQNGNDLHGGELLVGECMVRARDKGGNLLFLLGSLALAALHYYY
jgi:hypothetical protein